MKWRMLLILLLTAVLAGPAFAGLFGKKPTKPSPAERVPELLKILKVDGDEHKRVEAAEELRQYDPAAFPQLYPGLIDALYNDPKPSVRSEVAQSLGKMRPINDDVGHALEHARDKDDTMRVRIQARSSLLSYYWAGWRSAKPAQPPIQSKEPPLADTKNSNPAQVPVIRTQGMPNQPLPIQTAPVRDPAIIRPPPSGPSLTAPAPVQQPNQTSGQPAKASAPPTGSSLFRLLQIGPSKPPQKTTEPPLAPSVEPPLAPPTQSVPSLPPMPNTDNTGGQPTAPQPTQQAAPTGPDLGPQD